MALGPHVVSDINIKQKCIARYTNSNGSDGPSEAEAPVHVKTTTQYF